MPWYYLPNPSARALTIFLPNALLWEGTFDKILFNIHDIFTYYIHRYYRMFIMMSKTLLSLIVFFLRIAGIFVPKLRQGVDEKQGNIRSIVWFGFMAYQTL